MRNKEEQKQHLIDIMKSDEELGLYDESSPGYNHQVRLVNDLVKELKFEEVFNDEKREKVKRVIHQHKIPAFRCYQASALPSEDL